MALAFFLPLPCGDTTGGAVGMTTASTRTLVCGPLRRPAQQDHSYIASEVICETAAAIAVSLPLTKVLGWICIRTP